MAIHIPVCGDGLQLFSQVFLCRPLYDDPDFTVLGKLLDRPGLLYRDGSGLFEEVLKGMGNITIDVPIKEILR